MTEAENKIIEEIDRIDNRGREAERRAHCLRGQLRYLENTTITCFKKILDLHEALRLMQEEKTCQS